MYMLSLSLRYPFVPIEHVFIDSISKRCKGIESQEFIKFRGKMYLKICIEILYELHLPRSFV